jgi:stress-induced-phosphoprotein 1
LKDAEEAIKIDPTFVKGYIRKSLVLSAMKEYTKAMEAAQAASDADTERKHTKEIEEQMQKVSMALYTQRSGETEEETLQRAMRDPEVAVSAYISLPLDLHANADDWPTVNYAGSGH